VIPARQMTPDKLEEAADELVSSDRFDTLVRALSPILRRERVLQGVEMTEILREADERHSLTRNLERHSQSSTTGPWYEVTYHGGKLLYAGPNHLRAEQVQAAHRGSMLVGSLWGWSG
jgi:hypothetical protein